MPWTVTTKTDVQVPAQFAEAFLKDIQNWHKFSTSRVAPNMTPETSWEGEPWKVGTMIVMKMAKTAGIGLTVRSTGDGYKGSAEANVTTSDQDPAWRKRVAG